ncbi:2,4,5-trihydroxytoluene oxygenase [Pyruvatibacter sp.]|uniref:2,4,5-trihydroxytoluene oxygenase n=1 Tax=Pyruvatibacter sp. TaxID=1981328 RepID=UPI0032EC264A
MGIRVADIAYVRFHAPDLDQMEAFLTDFGLVRSHRTDDALYMRGAGDEPFIHVTHKGDAGFAGIAFLAQSVADLEVLATMPGASAIEDIDEPGGGKRVRFTDPNGHKVEVVAGRDSVGALALRRATPSNSFDARPRIGAPLRSGDGPAQVMRLGHCVLNVVDFAASEAWYKERFGLVTSDEIAIDDTTSIGAFMRCDLGATHVDHHTLFLVGTGEAGFNHAAFEVANIDDLMAGNTHLQSKGYTHEWGVGRHILGSQIFDYWRDPWGHTVEHWTDGDLFNNETPPNKQGLDTLLGVQWGPPPPPTLGS